MSLNINIMSLLILNDAVFSRVIFAHRRHLDTVRKVQVQIIKSMTDSPCIVHAGSPSHCQDFMCFVIIGRSPQLI